MEARRERNDDADDGVAGTVGQMELPLALVDLRDLTIKAVSKAAMHHIGGDAAAIIGHSALDVLPVRARGHASGALKSLRAGDIEFYRTHRILRAPAGSEPLASQWVRAFKVGDHRYALIEMAVGADARLSPLSEYFGHELRMAIGLVDLDWTIKAISSDISSLLDVSADDLVDRLLLGTIQQGDVAPLLAAASRAHETCSVALTVHVRERHGTWTPLCCVLTSLAGSTDRCFMLVEDPPRRASETSGPRVVQLENHLRLIAAEVAASGVLTRMGPMFDARRFPQIGTLSRREWEVLSRLLEGDRVPTIAADLSVSQSTIRNRLSVIFRRFGVHSQAELLELLREKDGPSS